MASPIPPPSAGKREVNEAAMALTWLAEAFTAAPVSPVPPRAPTAAADALLLADTGVPGQRGRRAASQRCTSIIREALQIERDTVHGPRIPGLEGTRATKRGKKEGEAGEKRPRGYSQVRSDAGLSSHPKPAHVKVSMMTAVVFLTVCPFPPSAFF